MKLDHILVPVDLSELSRHALAEAAALVHGRNSKVRVLHVRAVMQVAIMDFTYVEPPERLTAYCEAARKNLEVWCSELGLDEARAEVKVDVGDPVEMILRESQDQDLIVMAIKNHTGMQHLLLGSVTEHVMRAAKCSVLIVR